MLARHIDCESLHSLRKIQYTVLCIAINFLHSLRINQIRCELARSRARDAMVTIRHHYLSRAHVEALNSRANMSHNFAQVTALWAACRESRRSVMLRYFCAIGVTRSVCDITALCYKRNDVVCVLRDASALQILEFRETRTRAMNEWKLSFCRERGGKQKEEAASISVPKSSDTFRFAPPLKRAYHSLGFITVMQTRSR